MNWMDIVVILILLSSTFAAYKVGLVKTVLNSFSTIISLITAYILYPKVSLFLVGRGLFDKINQSVRITLNIKENLTEMTKNAQDTFINNLNIPNFLKNSLIENNTNDIYTLFNVSSIEDYITSYITNIFINIIAITLTFILTLILVKLVFTMIDAISKLPVINFTNKFLGAILGFVNGIIIIWILCILITFCYSNPSFDYITSSLESSSVSKMFYDNNLFIFMINDILKLN